MSEQTTEEAFGKAGVEQSLGYKPMPMADPVGNEEAARAEQAVKDYVARVDASVDVAAAPPIERAYQDVQTGAQRPINETVEIDQAAHDLSRRREADEMAEKLALESEIASAIDRIRAGDEQPQAPQPAPQPAQPQPNAQPEGDDAVARALQENPALLHEMQKVIAQEQAKSEYAQQVFAQAATQNAHTALASLVHNFPELQGLRVDQLPVAIQMIQNRDPGRAAVIVDQVNRVNAMAQQAQQAQQEIAARQFAAYRHQFNNWANQQDALMRLMQNPRSPLTSAKPLKQKPGISCARITRMSRLA